MSPELYFALSLVVKMAVTAGFVVLATMTAERAGPVIGGLVATLPLGAGPVYVFLALDHDSHFIANSAVMSLAISAVNAVFALTYAVLAQKRGLTVSIVGALAAWLILTFVVRSIAWTWPLAALLNVVVLGVCLVIARPLRHTPVPRIHPRWYELAMRAAMVALLVGVTVTLSFTIGPSGSGMLAVFPIILISIMLILHRRVGGPPTAAVMANGILGLVGFAIACSVLHFTAEPFGSFIGLGLTFATSITWGLGVYAARRRGFPL